MQPYTHLDLLAPMPDVEIDKPRVLMLEGSLKFRDHSSKMVAHIFLFTDMLLITKPRRGGDKYSIARPVSRTVDLEIVHAVYVVIPSSSAVQDLVSGVASSGTRVVPGAGPDAVPRADLLVQSQGSV